jgi:hypothetical protein
MPLRGVEGRAPQKPEDKWKVPLLLESATASPTLLDSARQGVVTLLTPVPAEVCRSTYCANASLANSTIDAASSGRQTRRARLRKSLVGLIEKSWAGEGNGQPQTRLPGIERGDVVVAATCGGPCRPMPKHRAGQIGCRPHFPLVAPAVMPTVLLCLCTERASYVMSVTVSLQRRCETRIAQGFSNAKPAADRHAAWFALGSVLANSDGHCSRIRSNSAVEQLPSDSSGSHFCAASVR